ncbi:MAG: methyltransferase [Gammaproteobacteria bacterium]|jgi:2-polyprenyl-3-methyl-5-hydroxy-6-metoxy-1,4-benzoquinol methylase|nr:methyltransferase [Gammaproteobacteria bacterium]
MYKGTAQYYSQYRPLYPAELVDILRAEKLLSKSAMLLDLGCGTGQLAIQLSPYFANVLGVDQEEEMIQQAALCAKHKHIMNIAWLCSAAESLSDSVGFFKLITIGRAFHWMDREKLVPWVHAHLEAGGALVTIGEEVSFWSGKEQWKKVVIEVVNHYLGDKRKEAKQVYVSADKKLDYAEHFRELFSEVKSYKFYETRHWDIELIKGFLYSTANSSQALFKEALGQFEQDLERALLSLNPKGSFTEEACISMLVAKK